MRSNSGLAASIFAVVILAVASAPSASAAPPDNPCSLLTRAQVRAVLGVSVDAGRLNTVGSKACTWIQENAALTGGKNVQVILSSGDEHDKNKAEMTQTGATAKQRKENASGMPTVTPTSGLGDDAYYTTAGRSTTLSVKKGGVGFNVAIRGANIPVDQQKSQEKDLAKEILSKL